jgi:hypothetical protein
VPGMNGARRRHSSHRIAFVGLLVVILTSCVTPGQGPATAPAATDPGIVAEVASYQLVAEQPGRLLVALLSADDRWLSFGDVGVSFEYLGDGSGSPAPEVVVDDATAEFLPIPGSPGSEGRRPTLTFAADGRGVYAVESITFPKAGFWQVSASGALADGLSFEAQAAFTVLKTPSVVTVGSLAPHTDNAVMGDPGVPPAAIDSRAAGGQPIPDPELHATSIADAIEAGHPALVVFSTPVYCVSRFCGPVTDLVADLAEEYADRADFIHVEIYRDFEAGLVNQAALDWLSPDGGELREPWTFLIDANGRIAASWDTVVTRSEIEPLLQSLPVIK